MIKCPARDLEMRPPKGCPLKDRRGRQTGGVNEALEIPHQTLGCYRLRLVVA
jgi:hypothetical protein